MNLEERIEQLKKEQENNTKKIEAAKIAQQEAEEARKKMDENLKKLEIAQNKYAEYEEAMKDIDALEQEDKEFAGYEKKWDSNLHAQVNVPIYRTIKKTNTSNENECLEYKEEQETKNSNKKVKELRFTAGVLSGIAGLAIIAGAYMLGKKSHEGPIIETLSVNDTLSDETAIEEKYIEASKEAIDERTNNLTAKFNQYGLKTEINDVKRLVYAININKIATDHPELIEEMIEEDSLEEVSQDFNQALMDINTYNGLIFRETGSTDEFIYISDALIDSSDKSKMQEIEKRFVEISKSNSDDELNLNVNKLLTELLLPEYDLSNLECGAGYASYTMVELIRDLFMDRLNTANQNLIKYFVPYAEDYYKDNLADSWVNNRHNCHLNNIEYIIENPYSLEEKNAKKLTK